MHSLYTNPSTTEIIRAVTIAPAWIMLNMGYHLTHGGRQKFGWKFETIFPIMFSSMNEIWTNMWSALVQGIYWSASAQQMVWYIISDYRQRWKNVNICVAFQYICHISVVAICHHCFMKWLFNPISNNFNIIENSMHIDWTSVM